MAKKNKMTKDTIPEGFTWQLAMVDFLPVLFFGGTGILLGMILKNPMVEICAFVVFLSGLLKVIWKIIAALQKKNIWPLFVQMRILMPIGFLAMAAGIIYSLAGGGSSLTAGAFTAMPQLLFFLLGILGLFLMILCAVKLDSADPKANWIEQGVNSAAQAFICIGMLLVYLGQ